MVKNIIHVFAMALCLLFLFPFTANAVPARPKLLQEKLLSLPPLYSRNTYAGDTQHQSQDIWRRILLDIGIDSPAPDVNHYSWEDCNYDTALDTLQQIRQAQDKSAAYEKFWAENQNRVFSMCNGSAEKSDAPITPKDGKFPARAQSDYLYQLASWHFYHHDYADALPIYQKIADDKNARARDIANYMVMRALMHDGRPEEAYAKAEAILADPSLKTVHAITENFRFVIMNTSRGDPIKPDAKLAEKHLRWLLTMIAAAPEKADHLQQSLNNYQDAMEQLNTYFPLFDKETKRIDWWLDTKITPQSGRMQAAKKLAPENELVDWMQAKWAFNIFDNDWLWALHQPKSSYWNQNHNIVQHAWQRWQQGGTGEWLQIAITRAHPDDALAPDIIKSASPYLDHVPNTEGTEYKSWVFDLWSNLLRLHVGRGEYDQALALISDHPEFKDLKQTQAYRSSTYEYEKVVYNVLRWLVYTGHVDEARQILAVALKNCPDSFQYWRTWLAKDWAEASVAGQSHSFIGNDAVFNDPRLWETMVDELSSENLFKLASDEKFPASDRALIARAIFTRALLLHKDGATTDRYAVLAAKLNPSAREDILAGVVGHDPNKYISLLLRMPRLRPLPYLEYAAKRDGDSNDPQSNPTAIDNFNHNDNNWWCQVSHTKISDRVFNAARIVPGFKFNSEKVYGYSRTINQFFKSIPPEDPEFKPYADKQKAILAQHPYHQLVDENEIRALAAIPMAPRYLTEAVISHEKIKHFFFWQPKEDKDQSAQQLHEAIRTTRYSCELDGSHAIYSKEAYDILHKQYAETPWAKATPYWFGCSHFRNGCEKQPAN